MQSIQYSLNYLIYLYEGTPQRPIALKFDIFSSIIFNWSDERLNPSLITLEMRKKKR